MSAATDVRLMGARFDSTCGKCGARIFKGSPIRYVKGMVANHDECGDPTVLASSTWAAKPSRSGHRRGYSTYSARCTHEDYPCCGCGQ